MNIKLIINNLTISKMKKNYYLIDIKIIIFNQIIIIMILMNKTTYLKFTRTRWQISWKKHNKIEISSLTNKIFKIKKIKFYINKIINVI